MKDDSYKRYVRSDQYKDFISTMKKGRFSANKMSLFTTKPMLMLTNSNQSSVKSETDAK